MFYPYDEQLNNLSKEKRLYELLWTAFMSGLHHLSLVYATLVWNTLKNNFQFLCFHSLLSVTYLPLIKCKESKCICFQLLYFISRNDHFKLKTLGCFFFYNKWHISRWSEINYTCIHIQTIIQNCIVSLPLTLLARPALYIRTCSKCLCLFK